jgi:hypothetical protein
MVQDRGEMLAQGLLHMPGHCLGEHRIDGCLSERTQAPGDGRDLRDVIAVQQTVPEVAASTWPVTIAASSLAAASTCVRSRSARSRTARSGMPADVSSRPALSSSGLGTRKRSPSASSRPSFWARSRFSAVMSAPNISWSWARVR